MDRETVYSVWPVLGLEAKVAFLRKEMLEHDVSLPEDAARFFARNFRSDARRVRDAIRCLVSHSTITGTPINLEVTKRVLGKYFALPGPRGTVDPFQGIFARSEGKKQATSPRKQAIEADSAVIFGI